MYVDVVFEVYGDFFLLVELCWLKMKRKNCLGIENIHKNNNYINDNNNNNNK